MASFASGVNAFLSSPLADKIVGPNPTTTRGCAIHINFHPTQPKIIYPSGKFIIIKNLEDPSDSFVYRAHAFPTTVAKFSPNGFWVASADSSGKVRVWAWDNPEHNTKLETSVFAGEVKDLDWDSESKKIVAVGDGNPMMAKVFTWDTGNSVGEMVGHNKRVLSVSYKPSRPFRIMTCSEDSKVLYYAGPPFKLDHSNSCHTNFVNCVRFSSNGEHCCSVSSDKKIQFYDGKTGQPTRDIANGHEGSVYSVAFSPDGTKFITASADKTVKLWDSSSFANECTFATTGDAQVGDMQVGALWTNANHILSVSLNGNINFWNPGTTSPLRVLQGHQVAIGALLVDYAKEAVYTGSFDGVVCSTSVTSYICTRLQGTDARNICGGAHGGKVVGMAQVGNQVYSVGWDDHIRVADMDRQGYHSEVATNGQPTGISANHTSDIYCVVTNKEIAVYRGLEKISFLETGSYTATCVSLLGTEEVAVGGSDFKTHVYSLVNNTLTEIATIETRSEVSCVSYSPLGDALAVGDNGRQVEVFERGSWAPRVKGRWVFHTSKVTSLAWSPSGSFLASGSQDENIFIWSFEKPTTKRQIPFAHAAGVTGVSWIAEDRLVSCGNDHCIVTWRIPVE